MNRIFPIIPSVGVGVAAYQMMSGNNVESEKHLRI
ncbi:DUF3918 family protein [Fictibacillus enclensis]